MGSDGDEDGEVSEEVEELLGEPGTSALEKTVFGEGVSKRMKDLASKAKETVMPTIKKMPSKVQNYVKDNVLPDDASMDVISDLAKGKEPSVVETMDTIDRNLN